MPARATALTGTAGEHFVAYKLSAIGYPVALTRGGSPTVDLMVGDLQGHAAVSVQVKTSNWAWRGYKRKTEKNHWLWDVGPKALKIRGELIYYAFVDLCWSSQSISYPKVFIVSSEEVADYLNPKWSRFMFRIWETDKEMYLERWDRIIEILNG